MSNYNQNSVNNFDPITMLNSPIQMANSSFIRSEIDRFESVHPSIYSIYELLEEIKNQPRVQSQIRDHIMIIEDSFVNSQEWTMSRSVLDLRIGLLGSLSSGKSSLVHRFLTGTYMQDESPEGGRFKKEIVIDNQSYLLLIRDEANGPDAQLTHWVDGIIFVFSLENEESFKTIYQYFTKMSHYRNMSDVPFILVGIQDGISESSPRMIQEDRARRLASELKRCTYYEACSTYGLNVENVFLDICHRIVQQRYGVGSVLARPITPQQQSPVSSNPFKLLMNSHSGPSSSHTSRHISVGQSGESSSMHANYRYDSQQLALSSPTPNLTTGSFLQTPTINGILKDRNINQATLTQTDKTNRSFKEPSKIKSSNLNEVPMTSGHEVQIKADPAEQLTPTSTPVQKRKEHKRRSNIFTPGKKDEDKHKVDRLGHGRAIPLKQGTLYKKGTNGINRDWKKKYVVLLDDGRIIYHPSFHDYENDAHGKEIILQRTTIKMPGVNKLRTIKTMNQDSNSNAIVTQEHHSGKIETPNSKKRHRRLHQNHTGASSTGSSTTSKSASSHNGADDDGDENIFIIISLDKQWIFEAQSNEERDEWVQAIEQQILFSLQNIESAKASRAAKLGGAHIADASSVQTIKFVAGNGFCADCEQINPTWASLNLGALICMECAAVHRHLGTHLSRVRSLELDEWTSDLLQIMRSIGNQMVNSIWESNTKGRTKPQPNATSSERERWIRDKYEQKLFLPQLIMSSEQARQSLHDAINDEILPTVILLLAHGKISIDDLNSTLVHLAAAKGNVVILQLLLWYGADPFALDRNGRSPLQYANNDCIQTLQNLTNNRTDSHKPFKQQITVSPIRATTSTSRQPVSSPAPPYDKLPSTVI